jgi:hypothetical protein
VYNLPGIKAHTVESSDGLPVGLVHGQIGCTYDGRGPGDDGHGHDIDQEDRIRIERSLQEVARLMAAMSAVVG